MNFLIIYLLLAAITLIFATVQNGREMAYCRALAPMNVLTPNWINFFFLGLLWFAYWPQYLVSRRVTNSLPRDPQARQVASARAMGIPMDGPRG